MHAEQRDPKSFREPRGFVDMLALLTLASAVGLSLVIIVTAVITWLG